MPFEVMVSLVLSKGYLRMTVAFRFENTPVDLTITSVVVAGWTGRNMEAVQHHIDELAALGITPPSQVPLYYRVSNTLLTQAETVDVLGSATSGEVEPFLVQSSGRIYLGLASDHTDRELEQYSVAASKQACPKPVARELWDFEAVKGHLDGITLKCWIVENGRKILYQEGTLAGIRPLSELCDAAGLTEGMAMLCGTFAAIGGVRPADRYRMEMSDPTNGKTISLSYCVTTLPIIS